MREPFTRWIAHQLREPAGRSGVLVALVLNRANRTINRGAVERLQIGRDDRVLEIGFGGGAALALILERTRALVAGVEMSAPSLEHARRRFGRELHGGRLELQHGTAAALPYGSSHFDRVLTVNTLYFWPDPAAGMRSIFGVLVPGGRFVLAIESRDAMAARAYARDVFTLFTAEETRALLEQAGFTGVVVDLDGPRLYATGRRP